MFIFYCFLFNIHIKVSIFKKNIEDIIKNQERFRTEILDWFNSDLSETKNILNDIKTNDDFIKKETKKLKDKFKKIKFKKTIHTLFFMHANRNEDYFVWWDKENEEAIILKYERK